MCNVRSIKKFKLTFVVKFITTQNISLKKGRSVVLLTHKIKKNHYNKSFTKVGCLCHKIIFVYARSPIVLNAT